MSKKIEPTEYLDEDCLFLALKLLDYRRMERDKFTFIEMKMEKYKHATAFEIFQNIAHFNKQGLLKIEKLNFDMSLASKKESEDIKMLRYLSMTKAPGHPLSLALQKTIDNNFNFYDLELIRNLKDYIFKFIDFDIKINQELRQKFIEWLKNYLKLFADGKLESKTTNYPRIEIQKENIKEKINEMSVKFGSMLALKDSNFDSEYRFFENILLLEKEKFLIIKNISSEKTEENLFSFSIHCELKEKSDSRPFLETEGDIGFLKFGKKREKIKIGKKDSQPFKLLKLLIENFGVKRKIDYIFEHVRNEKYNKIEKDRYCDPYLEPNRQREILENVKRELQKDKKLGSSRKKYTNFQIET